MYTYDLLNLCKPAFTNEHYLKDVLSYIFTFSRIMALCFTCSEGSDSLRVNDHIKGRHCRDKKISNHLTQRQKHQEETWLSGSRENKRGDILKDNFFFVSARPKPL